MFEDLRDLIAEQFGVEPNSITVDTSFADDLSADSVDLMELSMALEDAFGLEDMDPEAVESIKTVGDLCKYLQDHLDL